MKSRTLFLIIIFLMGISLGLYYLFLLQEDYASLADVFYSNIQTVFNPNLLPSLVKNFFNIFILLTVIVCAWGAGDIIIDSFRKFSGKFHGLLERFIFFTGLGYGLLSYLTFFLGILGLLFKGVFVLIYLFFLLLSLFKLYKKLKPGSMDTMNGLSEYTYRPTRSFSMKFCLVIILFSLFLMLIETLSPENFYDSLVYHLGTPNWYLLNNKIVPFRHVLHSNMPLTCEMLYLFSLGLNDGILAKLISLSFSILTVFAILSFSKKYFSSKEGVFASLIFLTSPTVMVNSTHTGVETGLGLFIFLSFSALVNWTQGKKNDWISRFGIFQGFALGTKYSAALKFFIFLGIVIVHSRKDLLKNVLCFCMPSFRLFSPWLLKNLYFVKNPFYPFLNNIFKSPYLAPEGFKLLGHHIGFGYFITLKNFLLHPFYLAFTIEDTGWLGPVFIFSLPFILLSWNSSPLKRTLLTLCCIWWLLLVLSCRVPRLYIPILPLLSVLASCCILASRFSRSGIFFVILLSTLNLLSFPLYSFYKESWNVVFGKISTEEYLSRRIAYSPFPVISFINKNLPDDAKILFLNEPRTFYCRKHFITNSVFDYSPLRKWEQEAHSPSGLLTIFRRENITHILENNGRASFIRTSLPGKERKSALFENFKKRYLKQIYSAGDVCLYELKNVRYQ